MTRDAEMHLTEASYGNGTGNGNGTGAGNGMASAYSYDPNRGYETQFVTTYTPPAGDTPVTSAAGYAVASSAASAADGTVTLGFPIARGIAVTITVNPYGLAVAAATFILTPTSTSTQDEIWHAHGNSDPIPVASTSNQNAQQVTTHGNSLTSQRQTVLYQLVDRSNEAVLKYGITSNPRPTSRYSAGFYARSNSRMQVIETYQNRLAAGIGELEVNAGYSFANGRPPPLTKIP